MPDHPEMTPQELRDACTAAEKKAKVAKAAETGCATTIASALAVLFVAVFGAFVLGVSVGTFVWAYRLIAGGQ
jgi:hypothetical protein